MGSYTYDRNQCPMLVACGLWLVWYRESRVYGGFFGPHFNVVGSIVSIRFVNLVSAAVKMRVADSLRRLNLAL
jgi:hypothetical protein